MLVMNTDLWKEHRIIKVYSETSEVWAKPDSSIIAQCVLDNIKKKLEDMAKNSTEAILIIDLTKGSFPPWIQAIKIARFFVSLKNLIQSSLTCTIVYSTKPTHEMWVNRILKIYTPAKPLHITNNKDEIRKIIGKYR